MPRRKQREISVAVSGPDSRGYFYAFLTVGKLPNGEPDRRRRSGRTVDEVKDKIRKLEDELANNAVADVGGYPKLDAALLEFAKLKRPHVKYKTWVGYMTDINCHLIPNLGGHRVDTAEPKNVLQMYETMAKQGLAPGTIHHAYRTLRTAYGVWVRHDKTGRLRNVAELAGPPRLDEAEIVPLTQDEAKRVILGAEKRTNGSRWGAALALGFRQGEALGLAWDETDLRWVHGCPEKQPCGLDDPEKCPVRSGDGSITILRRAHRQTWQHGCADPHACAEPHCRTEPCRPVWEHGCPADKRCKYERAWRCPDRKPGARCPRHLRATCPPPCAPDCTKHASLCPARRDGGIVYDTPKSRKGRRTVAVPGPLAVWMLEHRDEQKEAQELAGDKWGDNGLVWCGPFGEPIDSRRDWADWQDLLVSVDVEPRGTHAGRHTAATLALITRVDRRVVMDIMGWSRASMLTRYQEVVDEVKRDAAKRMGGALWPTD